MMTLEQIREEAMALPEVDRVLLGEELREPDLSTAELTDIERAWQEEALRRLEEVRGGKTALLSLDEVLQSLERRVGL